MPEPLHYAAPSTAPGSGAAALAAALAVLSLLMVALRVAVYSTSLQDWEPLDSVSAVAGLCAIPAAIAGAFSGFVATFAARVRRKLGFVAALVNLALLLWWGYLILDGLGHL